MTPLSPSLLPTLTSGKSQSAFCPPNPSWDCFIFKIPSGLKKMEWGKVWEESEGRPDWGRGHWGTKSSQRLLLGVEGVHPGSPGLARGWGRDSGKEGD